MPSCVCRTICDGVSQGRLAAKQTQSSTSLAQRQVLLTLAPSTQTAPRSVPRSHLGIQAWAFLQLHLLLSLLKTLHLAVRGTDRTHWKSCHFGEAWPPWGTGTERHRARSGREDLGGGRGTGTSAVLQGNGAPVRPPRKSTDLQTRSTTGGRAGPPDTHTGTIRGPQVHSGVSLSLSL